jgi:nucleotide-binding universal stress UspA family protein
MTRIVVGIDGSDAGAAALRWAGNLSASSGARLSAVHAFAVPYAEVPPGEQQRLVAERREIVAREWLRPVEELGVTVDGETTEGDPRWVLPEAAESAGADLLVIGRSGRGGGPGFLHLGSVVEYLAHHTRVPLAVIPPFVHGPIRRIVVGVDGSEASRAAVDWCARYAPSLGATVLATAVREPIFEWTPSWDPNNWRRATERHIQDWVEPLTDAGVAVEAIADENLNPADGLLGVASARSADLLVLGTRGAGGFLDLRFGGVAMKVLHRASLPLVLVPPTVTS